MTNEQQRGFNSYSVLSMKHGNPKHVPLNGRSSTANRYGLRKMRRAPSL